VKAATLLVLLLAPCALFAGPPSGAVIHEPGAIYLEGLVPRPIRVPVQEEAPIYYHVDMERYLGVLRKGQQVELQAIGPDEKVFRVRGLAQQGQVAGWVEARFLAPLKPEFVEGLKQNFARQEEVKALVSRGEVAINMTADEVTAALGKPGRKSSKLDAAGRQEVWEFVRFERVPQQVQSYDRFGRLVFNTYYVKVPSGKLSVVFEKNLVIELEQTEGSLERDARARIVTAPLVVNF
jgi:hypothetical protein